MIAQLRPSFVRCAGWVISALAMVTVPAYLWQGYHENHWWTLEYLRNLLIPFGIAPVIVWLMFVPKRLEFTPTDLTVQFFLRQARTLPWEELKYYGRGNNVFLMQFDGQQAFQIFSHAFPKDNWRLLTNFLAHRYPDRKASGWIGPFGFKWPWRRNRDD